MEKEVERLFSQELLKEAARRFGLADHDFRKLGDFENYVYEAMDHDGIAKILRLTHSSHRSAGEVAAELDYISHLVAAGVDIPACYPSKAGRLTEVFTVEDSEFTVCLFEKAGGKSPDSRDPEVWNGDLFREWGRVTGAMHQATKKYQAPEGAVKRPDWDDDTDLLGHADRYVEKGDEYVLDRLTEAMGRMRQLPINRDVYGLIHTDIHMGNFFVENGRLRVFDFDDSAYNWFVHDLAIPLYYTMAWTAPEEEAERKAYADGFFRSFWEGYRQVNPLPAEWLEEIPAFLILRDVCLYLVLNMKVEPEKRDDGLIRFINSIKDRLSRNVPIVELDFSAYR
ncbi:phosphotransferase enzyme family protein [Gorillibacterium massiliense]|uniref:phosphotransferase enzyme family protein n=1 Tax=Gorillibacterium massiliense TaxID=1280390 RepID=UPI0004ACF140|nr:phosphotransferase [Gorillibacterium massiliense]